MPTGVYKRGVYAKRKCKPRKHGMCNIPEYKVWLQMRDRCKNPNNTHYSYYGGRGISVSTEWNSFKTFIADMGRRPKGYSLDRIDPNGNYSRENCRWATKIEQANNTRDNRKVEWNGKVYGIRELSEKTGVSQKLLAKRLFERMWSVERAAQNVSFIGRNQFSN
jgi:hypothetical protein